MTARLTRRSFLALAGVVVAGGGAAAAKLLAGGGTEWSGPASTVAALFDDPHAVQRLGQAYVDRTGETNREALLAQIGGATERAIRAGDVEATRTLVRQRAAAEAAAGRLIAVDGWLVAPTEARLAAVLAAT